MKIADSSDWRSTVPFETGVLASSVVPGEPARCVSCGPDSAPLERTELWAYKHRHPKNHSGFVRFYCIAHVPADRRPEPPASAPARRTPGSSAPRSAARTSAPRRPAELEITRAVCPDCFVETTAAGVCSMCGNPVT